MIELDERKFKEFVYAVKNQYWYQMYIDDLPIWGAVGREEEKKYYIFTHKRFDISYNGKQIVDINLVQERKELLAVGAKIKFTYEVNWKQSDTPFEKRFNKYLDPNFFQHRVSTNPSCLVFTQHNLIISLHLHNFRFTGSVFSTVS